MNILIREAEILDPRSKWNGKKANIHVRNGKIAYIGEDSPQADKVLEAKGMKLTIGWFDMQAGFCDPGLEHKEDLASGIELAASGGYTGVALVPNTFPVVQSKNEVSYIKSRTAGALTEVYPMAAITRDCKGEELTEMIDLQAAGAAAFTEGWQPIWHTDILLKSLQYVQKFNGLIINRPEDKRLNLFGTINEGLQSTLMGLKGMPNLSEELVVARDLEVLAYAGGRLHLSNISTPKSLALIKEAKKKGLNVTCDMAAYQLSFDDTALATFDSHLKVNPPFRHKKDNASLLKGLADGTIDVLVSAHNPQDIESKQVEFDHAEFGIISLQTMAAHLVELAQKLDLGLLLEKVTIAPRKILGLPLPLLEEGAEANLTLLDPQKEWILNERTNRSKSTNSPFWGKPLKGAAIAVFNKGQYLLFHD